MAISPWPIKVMTFRLALTKSFITALHYSRSKFFWQVFFLPQAGGRKMLKLSHIVINFHASGPADFPFSYIKILLSPSTTG